MNIERVTTVGVVFMFLCWAAFWGTIIYVAYHFISKVW